jgi:hypothetical protein
VSQVSTADIEIAVTGLDIGRGINATTIDVVKGTAAIDTGAVIEIGKRAAVIKVIRIAVIKTGTVRGTVKGAAMMATAIDIAKGTAAIGTEIDIAKGNMVVKTSTKIDTVKGTAVVETGAVIRIETAIVTDAERGIITVGMTDTAKETTTVTKTAKEATTVTKTAKEATTVRDTAKETTTVTKTAKETATVTDTAK